MLSACILLAVSICFVKKNKWLSFTLQTLSYIALIGLGVCSATFKNNFWGSSIFAIVSIAPMFLSLIEELKPANQKGTPEFPKAEKNTEFKQNSIEKPTKSAITLPNFKNIAYFLSVILLCFVALYLGKESAFGILAGAALGFALVFLKMALKKSHSEESTSAKVVSFLNEFFVFLSIGLLVCQIVPVLLYSFTLPNILFAAGLLVYAAHIALATFVKSRFNHLLYFAAMILILSIILF